MWNAAAEMDQRTVELLGEVGALAERVGAPGVAISEGSAARGGVAAIGSPAILREWLDRCRDELLVRQELPMVLRAWQLARQGYSRELVALDEEWGRLASVFPFSEASMRVGQRQMNRLRPLRDVRVVQRYLDAIGSGQAKGWHPIVYGLVLAVFNLPLQQGLTNFGAQSLAGLTRAATRDGRIPEAAAQAILNETVSTLAATLPALPSGDIFHAARNLRSGGPGHE
jgi:urease accessory protein UreF